VLAESPQFDGTAIAIFIAIFLVVAIVSLGSIVLGFVLAPRAARGSSKAMGWWVVALAIEGLGCLSSLGALASGGLNWRVPILPAIVAAQLAIYFRAKRNLG
jgi:hypothetical protein